jgi:hypothetical protein
VGGTRQRCGALACALAGRPNGGRHCACGHSVATSWRAYPNVAQRILQRVAQSDGLVANLLPLLQEAVHVWHADSPEKDWFQLPVLRIALDSGHQRQSAHWCHASAGAAAHVSVL